MNRTQALELVKQRVSNKNLIFHMIAVGAAMKSLAHRLGGDEEKWELAGILHDLDIDRTISDFPQHGLISHKILSDMGIEPEITSAVRAHPAHKDYPPQTPMEWSLHIVDPLTGLIVAATLMHPTKKLANVDADFVLRRFDEKRFAAGANREQIKLCEAKLNIPIQEFTKTVLEAMQSVSAEIGL